MCSQTIAIYVLIWDVLMLKETLNTIQNIVLLLLAHTQFAKFWNYISIAASHIVFLEIMKNSNYIFVNGYYGIIKKNEGQRFKKGT